MIQLEASNEAGRIDRFQLDLARQALYNAQSQLLTAEAVFQGTVENFQTNLGLPPELEVVIRDPLLDRFNLLDSDLEGMKDQIADLLTSLRERRQELVEATENQPGRGAPELQQRLTQELAAADVAIAQLTGAIDARLGEVRDDLSELEAALPARREALTRLVGREEVQAAQIDVALFDPTRLDSYMQSRRDELDRLAAALERTSDDLAAYSASPQQPPLDRADAAIKLLSSTTSELLELSLLQASIRLEAINIDPIEIDATQALAIASAYRRDWMNARANLVDAWRLIYFNANDLESDVDLIFGGDIGNVGQNPFDLRASNGRLRLGLQFDAPLTRLAERNVYRQSLIEYQQARRNYYQYRDQVYLALRNSIRQLRLNEVNLELRRAAVQLAISQVDLTQLRLSEPPQPGEVSELSNTTARDLVQSLSDLLNVQNDFLSVWVNYEVQRLNLEFDLGVMELDSRGLRVDTKVPYTAYLGDLPSYPSDLYPGILCPPGMGPLANEEDWEEIRQVPALEPEPSQVDFMPNLLPEGPGTPERLPPPDDL